MKPLHPPIIIALLAPLGGCVADANHEPSERPFDQQRVLLSASIGGSFSLLGMTTSIQTGNIPANWYKSSAGDVPITVIWNSAATACKSEEIASFGSNTTGSFAQIWNLGGQLIGLSWSAKHDLTGLEHHWYNDVGCDGTSRVVGCKDARKVTYTLSAYDRCLETTPNCAVGGSVWLQATHDPDKVQANCPMSCPDALAACIASCRAACAGSDPSGCRCCECDCRDAIHERNSACPAPPVSCYVIMPKYPACL